MRVIAVIPARFGSTRFPGKPLAPILGKPMIERVYARVSAVKSLSAVFVATDDRRIFQCVRGFGGKALLTSRSHATGSDRVAAAVSGLRYDWVLNIQGDEPLVPAALLRALIRRARGLTAPAIVTAVAPLRGPGEFGDPNVVKAVVGLQGRALYFSRSPVPNFSRAGRRPARAWKHIGIYLFHRRALQRFARSGATMLEKTESLEQLRALERGLPVYAVKTAYSPVAVDVPADVGRVERLLRGRGNAQ